MVKREKAFKETKRIVGTGSLMIESPGKLNECSNCNKNVNTYSFRFTQCKVVNYCSKKCQQNLLNRYNFIHCFIRKRTFRECDARGFLYE